MFKPKVGRPGVSREGDWSFERKESVLEVECNFAAWKYLGGNIQPPSNLAQAQKMARKVRDLVGLEKGSNFPVTSKILLSTAPTQLVQFANYKFHKIYSLLHKIYSKIAPVEDNDVLRGPLFTLQRGWLQIFSKLLAAEIAPLGIEKKKEQGRRNTEIQFAPRQILHTHRQSLRILQKEGGTDGQAVITTLVELADQKLTDTLSDDYKSALGGPLTWNQSFGLAQFTEHFKKWDRTRLTQLTEALMYDTSKRMQVLLAEIVPYLLLVDSERFKVVVAKLVPDLQIIIWTLVLSVQAQMKHFSDEYSSSKQGITFVFGLDESSKACITLTKHAFTLATKSLAEKVKIAPVTKQQKFSYEVRQFGSKLSKLPLMRISLEPNSVKSRFKKSQKSQMRRVRSLKFLPRPSFSLHSSHKEYLVTLKKVQPSGVCIAIAEFRSNGSKSKTWMLLLVDRPKSSPLFLLVTQKKIVYLQMESQGTTPDDLYLMLGYNSYIEFQVPEKLEKILHPAISHQLLVTVLHLKISLTTAEFTQISQLINLLVKQKMIPFPFVLHEERVIGRSEYEKSKNPVVRNLYRAPSKENRFYCRKLQEQKLNDDFERITANVLLNFAGKTQKTNELMNVKQFLQWTAKQGVDIEKTNLKATTEAYSFLLDLIHIPVGIDGLFFEFLEKIMAVVLPDWGVELLTVNTKGGNTTLVIDRNASKIKWQTHGIAMRFSTNFVVGSGPCIATVVDPCMAACTFETDVTKRRLYIGEGGVTIRGRASFVRFMRLWLALTPEQISSLTTCDPYQLLRDKPEWVWVFEMVFSGLSEIVAQFKIIYKNTKSMSDTAAQGLEILGAHIIAARESLVKQIDKEISVLRPTKMHQKIEQLESDQEEIAGTDKTLPALHKLATAEYERTKNSLSSVVWDDIEPEECTPAAVSDAAIKQKIPIILDQKYIDIVLQKLRMARDFPRQQLFTCSQIMKNVPPYNQSQTIENFQHMVTGIMEDKGGFDEELLKLVPTLLYLSPRAFKSLLQASKSESEISSSLYLMRLLLFNLRFSMQKIITSEPKNIEKYNVGKKLFLELSPQELGFFLNNINRHLNCYAKNIDKNSPEQILLGIDPREYLFTKLPVRTPKLFQLFAVNQPRERRASFSRSSRPSEYSPFKWLQKYLVKKPEEKKLRRSRSKSMLSPRPEVIIKKAQLNY